MEFRRILLQACMWCVALGALAADFDTTFEDNTLRIDVKVLGRDQDCIVSIDSLAQWPGWYGRRVNLTRELYPETVQIVMIDSASGDTIYVDSMTSNGLAEEDDGMPVYIPMFVPKPRAVCDIIANIYWFERNEWSLCGSGSVQLGEAQLAELHSCKSRIEQPVRTLRAAADTTHCINLAIIAEGYTADEADRFFRKAESLDSVMFTCQPPFRDNAERFNVVAVMLDSPESGLSVPSEHLTVRSALGAHFDSFGLDRLVTIPDTRPMWDVLEGVPAAHILILGNTERYGGSGAYNEYAIASDGPPYFEEILIHEFGHSFAALGDEYESGYADMYTPDIEPMEPNITTMHDFTGKWANLIETGEASLIEGAGYQEKGVWRGCEKCLMRDIADRTFCPVCSQAITRIIDFYTRP